MNSQDWENPQFIIYTTKDTDVEQYPAIKAHLEKFRPILENRRECREGNYPWFRLHRARDQRIFEGEKIVNPQRSETNTFAYQDGEFYASVDVYFTIPRRGTRENIKYICSILNSTLIRFWLVNKCKLKGKALELYYAPLSRIPIRRIDFDNPEDVQLHDEIVEKVKTIREKMAELAGYSKYFKGIRLTRLKPEDPLPDMNPEAIVQSLTPEKRFSLRTHPEIRVNHSLDFQEANFILSRVEKVSLTLEGAELKLHSKGRKVLLVSGEQKLLTIIARILEEHQGKSWASIKEMPFVPQNTEEFEAKKRQIFDTASKIRIQIQDLQKSVDMMVSELYGFPGGLGK